MWVVAAWASMWQRGGRESCIWPCPCRCLTLSSTLDIELDATLPMCPEPDLNTCRVAFHQRATSLDLFPSYMRLWRQLEAVGTPGKGVDNDFILIIMLTLYI